MIKAVVNRAVLPLLAPVAVLLSAWLILPYHTLLPDSLTGLMDFAPYWLLTIMLLLGLTYNRSRLVLTAVILCLGFFLFNQQPHLQSLTMEQASLLELSVLGIIPINLAWISTYRERGIFTFHGAVRCGAILLQVIFITWIFYFPQQSLFPQQLRMQIMQYPFLSSVYPSSGFLSELPYTHAIQTLLFLGTALTMAAAYYFNTYLSFGLLGTFAGYLAGTLFPGEAYLLAANISAGSLLLCTALLRDSYNMAYRDELTGLPQRRALNEHLMTLGTNYTLAMLDVDHFKKFNDTHGHDVGDQVLQMVASQIARVRGGGKAYRFGGEEFVVVFASQNISDANYYLDEVRKSIQNYEMIIRDKSRPENPEKQKRFLRERGSYRRKTTKVSVTISIGVAGRRLRQELAEDVLKKSDQALYRAKQAGRNQVVTEQPLS